jgi:predicted ribosome quality control (RQC) complex YloA/Tae2 family protein
LRHSRGNEWWFHARDVPGAHVLVKCSLGILPEPTLREAALLAAHFSKSQSGTVQYTQVKFVKKPKNSKPGLMSISREKVIDVEVNEEVLAKILKTSGAA